MTDSRARIAIYGSKDVAHSLSSFIRLGTQTLTPEGIKAFAELCVLMRMETVKQCPSFEDIMKILFG